MPTSTANAVWEGGLKNGNGKFTAKSGAFHGNYNFGTRFEGEKGTNPEELIAAAHAACLSMALAAGLEAGGTPATRIGNIVSGGSLNSSCPSARFTRSHRLPSTTSIGSHPLRKPSSLPAENWR